MTAKAAKILYTKTDEAPMKAYSRKHPHEMGAWSSDSKTPVAYPQGGDFRSNEKSMTTTAATEARIYEQSAQRSPPPIPPPSRGRVREGAV